MALSGTPGQAGELLFDLLKTPGGNAIASGVVFTSLFTRGAAVETISVTFTDIGVMPSGLGRNYRATWTWPSDSGLYRLIIENGWNSGVLNELFEVGVGGGEVTQSDIDGVNANIDANPAAVADLNLTSHNVSGSLAEHVKTASQLVPSATENVTVRANDAAGTAQPRVAFTVRSSGGVVQHRGFTSHLGVATIQLPVGDGYTIAFTKLGTTWAIATFNVTDGGGTVIVAGTQPSFTVVGS